ncbi:AraC family transcriptional regulator [Termitidicoccus mucosus]
MPAKASIIKETLHAACNGRDAGIFLLSAQCLREETGERHRLIVMPEMKSEARIDWRNEKSGERGTFTVRGQNVIFIHKQASYALHWKQEALMLCFCAEDEAQPPAKKKPLDKVRHSPLWELARHDCIIMNVIRFLVESGHHTQPACHVSCFGHFCSALGFLLLDALTRGKEKKTAPATMNPERLQHVLDHIDKNLHGKIAVKTLADIACLSRTHFKLLFKASTGMPARDHIFRERIRRAQALLRQGGMRISEVAALSGFCDQSHLDRCFRRFCQCSPRDFAQKYPIITKKSPGIQSKPGKTGHNGGTL